MSRSTKRVAVIAALALLAGLALATGSTPAASQAPAARATDPARPSPSPRATRCPPVEAGTGQVSPPAPVPVARAPQRHAATTARPATRSRPSPSRSSVPTAARRSSPRPTIRPGPSARSRASTASSATTSARAGSSTATRILTAGPLPVPAGQQPSRRPSAFFPGRNASTDPYGSCIITTGFSPFEWVQNQNEYNDWAVVHLNCNIGDTVGWFGYFSVGGQTALRHLPAVVQGYPGDKPFGTMWGMGGRIAASQKKMVFYDMDTFGGQSGSPVYYNRSECGGPCGDGHPRLREQPRRWSPRALQPRPADHEPPLRPHRELRRRQRLRRPLVACALVAGLVLVTAGCGGDDADEVSTTGSSEPPTSVTTPTEPVDGGRGGRPARRRHGDRAGLRVPARRGRHGAL